MLEAFKDFMRSIGSDHEGRRPGKDAASDPRTAVAALLFHVSEADGAVTEVERDLIARLLSDEFGIDESAAESLAEAGREADRDAVDLFRFTNVLMQTLSEERRIHFVELLWEITFSDGRVHELEDNIIWRIADLLGVSTRDRMRMKRLAAQRVAIEAPVESGVGPSQNKALQERERR